LCPRDGLSSLSESHTIGISDIEADRTAEFLRVVANQCIEFIEDALHCGAGGFRIHESAEATEVREQDVGVGNDARAVAPIDTVHWCRLGEPFERELVDERSLNFRRCKRELGSR